MKITYERNDPYVRQGLAICNSCGSVISSEIKHTKWHESLESDLMRLVK